MACFYWQVRCRSLFCNNLHIFCRIISDVCTRKCIGNVLGRCSYWWNRLSTDSWFWSKDFVVIKLHFWCCFDNCITCGAQVQNNSGPDSGFQSMNLLCKLRLPETLGKPLPQTIEEAEENYNRKRYTDENEMDELEKDSVFENFEDATDWKKARIQIVHAHLVNVRKYK